MASEKECPCKHLVRVDTSTEGKFDLLNLKLDQAQKNIERYNNSIREMRQNIAECLTDMAEGSQHFKSGAARFDRIEKSSKVMWYALGLSYIGIAASYLVLAKTGHGEALADILIKWMS